MESIWFIVFVSLCLAISLKAFLNLLSHSHPLPLPPGPFNVPIITALVWLRKSFSELEPILRNLHAKHGPIFALRFRSHPRVFIADRNLAHHALIQNGAACSDRPKADATSKIFNRNQHNISSASYGPTWRLFRRNLTSEILHPSRVKSFSRARKWVLEILLRRLQSESVSGKSILVVDHFQYAMFCLLVLMCFGDKLDEKQIKEIEVAQRRILLNLDKFIILNFFPRIGKVLFRKRWNELFQMKREQEEVLVPLIRARKKANEERKLAQEGDEFVLSYVDTLLDLQLPEDKRKLDEGEMVSLCSEFLNAGTDTTSTALQWVMANLVKYPHVQERILEEIKGVMDNRDENEVKEEDLHKLQYLKAVILEGLRRHPPGHFVLPHAVTEDVVLNGYVVPKNGILNFMVAEMGWDPNVWEEPMAFKPERFLNENNSNGVGEVFDITGSREIKMMPFGAGRRMCPASGLALLHLEYFVANLVWKFEWKTKEGCDVDLSEQQVFTVVMKNPLEAHVSPRF
ncbi:putative Cytochrome P450 [Quillaja saponaria]|uniref:Cytochrome P450 n=1 Tax=Quillaja saponaria TaxID=32244 RepID=A0AAD7LK15_QUISA|nr:putative Cytochrome P450 [Quillaja saponaria]